MTISDSRQNSNLQADLPITKKVLFKYLISFVLVYFYSIEYFNYYYYNYFYFLGDEITQQEDVWEVIGSYFDQKGLVSQQLDSFNRFIKNTMQEIIDDTPEIILKKEVLHRPGQEFVDLKVISSKGKKKKQL